MPRFCGATRRSTRVRTRQRSPCRPAGKSSYKSASLGLRWRLTTDAPPPNSTAGMACRSKPASIVAESRCSVYLRPCLFTMSRTTSLTMQGLTSQHIFDLGIREGQPGFAPHLLPNIIHAADHAEFQTVRSVSRRDGVVDAHEVHCPAAQVHEEHGRFVLQKPHFSHKGGVALWEDGNFFDSDAVLHTLELVVHRLVASQQIIFELGFVAPKAGQRQPRRNAHRAFGRQAALPDFFLQSLPASAGSSCRLWSCPLDRLPPGATNKKAPAKL